MFFAIDVDLYRWLLRGTKPDTQRAVIHVDGDLVACFPAAEGDEGADLPVGDLAGQFLPLE